MNVEFPDFMNAVTPGQLALLRDAGWLKGQRIFANAQDFFNQANGNVPTPMSGPAKFYCSVQPIVAPCQIFVKRGTAIVLTWDAARWPLHLKIFSGTVVNFILERGIPVPDLEMRPISVEEQRRLSFNDSIDDPMDAPLCEVTEAYPDRLVHDFPPALFPYVLRETGSILLATYDDPSVRAIFPPAPQLGTPVVVEGFTAADMVGLARAALTGSQNRSLMDNILRTSLSDQDKARELRRILLAK